MAEGIKISEMEEVTELTENTFLPVIKDGVNKKCRVTMLKVDDYSIEEQIIGIWENGKPIYRTVIDVTRAIQYEITTDGKKAQFYLNLTNLHIDYYFKSIITNVVGTCDYYIYDQRESSRQHDNYNIKLNIDNSGGVNLTRLNVTQTKTSQTNFTMINYSFSSGKVIIEHTKTTD